MTDLRCDTPLVQVLHAPEIAFKGDGWTEKGDAE